jgi:hypothetical protein
MDRCGGTGWRGDLHKMRAPPQPYGLTMATPLLLVSGTRVRTFYEQQVCQRLGGGPVVEGGWLRHDTRLSARRARRLTPARFRWYRLVRGARGWSQQATQLESRVFRKALTFPIASKSMYLSLYPP